MRISFNWLSELVEITVPVERVAERLTFSGTKVENIERLGVDVSGVIVAEVLNVAEHPNADNLVVVDVAAGGDESQRVVCGARNFAVGDRVPYARVGARLPGVEISRRKIRGEESSGMLCSGAELGVSKDHSGILVLPSDTPVGEDVVTALRLDDTILDLEITPNRPDCMSMVGLAREVAALLGSEPKYPEIDLKTSDELAARVTVEIDDPQGCPRYVARYLEGVSIGPSPSRIAARLLTSGIRPISNVVDATNYVMLERGQPLHAFDAAKVHDHRIIVRRARTAERMTTLDGVERSLHPDDLVIADAERALALAGVMGGEDSEVSDATTAVILESAVFDHRAVAFTSRRHVIRSEASARFEHKADIEIPPVAAARCAQLIVELAGGAVAETEVDVYPARRERRSIELRPARTDAVLGVATPPDRQADLLRAIGLEVAERDGALATVVPGFRPDLEREIDLIEEVGRLAGFERLPATLPPGTKGGLDAEQAADRTIRRTLAGFGLTEAWTASFSGPGELDALGLPDDHPARRLVPLANPTQEDRRALRTTLLPGLLRSAARNFAHHSAHSALFEVARVFEPRPGELPREAEVAAAVFAGARSLKTWNEPSRPWDFFAAKGVLEGLADSLHLPPLTFTPATGMPFHATRAAAVALGPIAIGVVGELHPDVCDRFDVPERTVAFEIALGPLYAALPPRPRVEELPRFPAIYIDVALIVDEAVAADRLLDRIHQAGAPEVTSVRLFDLYRGDQVAAGKKSLAYALELRDPTRTLTDEDARRVRDRIVQTVSEEFDATLRGSR